MLVGLSCVLAVALGCAVLFGEQPISLSRALGGEAPDAVIFWSLRWPRAALAALVGAALAASGCALQGLTRNPLAEPLLLGVSGGAALGATLALALGLGGIGLQAGWVSDLGPQAFALGGALLATVLVFALGELAGGRGPHVVLLAGVIVNAFALAAVTFIKTLAAPDKLGQILYWLAGAIGYERSSTLLLAAALQALALGGLWALSGQLNLLALGDEDAASLGAPVRRVRGLILLFASLAVAVAVALAGLVGFVGLVVPHLLRLRLGADNRLLLPGSALGGAAFLVLADLAARSLFPWFGAEPPVGALTALIGGPLFLLLLARRA